LSQTTLETLERQTGENPQWSVIWLHGLGADGHDFAPIVPELVRADWPAIRFVFPHAPMRPVTINGGLRMRAWYDITSLDFGQRQEDAAGIRESISQVEALIARENARGIPDARIVLAGFSQGGAIALGAGLRRAQSLAGLVALSTYLPLAADTARESTPAGRSIPVFMAHGRMDPVIPLPLGAASRDALRGLGMDVSWHDYAMPHSVCAEQILDLAGWLGARFAGG
jgi:phospholipase/carboxylesterase